MKKKKNNFTLIEVIIAILLTTMACFFLLQFEENYIKNSRASLIKVQHERLVQEAFVQLLEQLYLNRIDWKLMHDKKSLLLPLSEPDWEAEVSFTPIQHREREQIEENVMEVEVALSLIHDQCHEPAEPKIRLCLKKEEHKNVQAPQT